MLRSNILIILKPSSTFSKLINIKNKLRYSRLIFLFFVALRKVLFGSILKRALFRVRKLLDTINIYIFFGIFRVGAFFLFEVMATFERAIFLKREGN